MDQDGTWNGGGPWSRSHCARWGHSFPPPKKGRTGGASQFLAHVYCGQTAGWIKTPLGTEVDLGAGHFVLDRFPAVGERGTAVLLFSVHTGHGRPSQLLYIQLLMDNTDSANVDFPLTQTMFSTRCHQNTSVNIDCVAVWTPELRPIGRQLFTDGS